MPQAPQFAPLERRSTQRSPQAVSPVGQTREQVPPRQLCPLGHALPHRPQWLRLVWGSTQTPAHATVVPGQETQRPSLQMVPGAHGAGELVQHGRPAAPQVGVVASGAVAASSATSSAATSRVMSLDASRPGSAVRSKDVVHPSAARNPSKHKRLMWGSCLDGARSVTRARRALRSAPVRGDFNALRSGV
jgi:hypothetical protein